MDVVLRSPDMGAKHIQHFPIRRIVQTQHTLEEQPQVDVLCHSYIQGALGEHAKENWVSLCSIE